MFQFYEYFPLNMATLNYAEWFKLNLKEARKLVLPEQLYL